MTEAHAIDCDMDEDCSCGAGVKEDEMPETKEKEAVIESVTITREREVSYEMDRGHRYVPPLPPFPNKVKLELRASDAFVFRLLAWLDGEGVVGVGMRSSVSAVIEQARARRLLPDRVEKSERAASPRILDAYFEDDDGDPG